jgi:hypothetical protein
MEAAHRASQANSLVFLCDSYGLVSYEESTRTYALFIDVYGFHG